MFTRHLFDWRLSSTSMATFFLSMKTNNRYFQQQIAVDFLFIRNAND